MNNVLYYSTYVVGGHNAKEICKDVNGLLGRRACAIVEKQAGGIYKLELLATQDESDKYDFGSDFMLSRW
jgi:hypothetical protein